MGQSAPSASFLMAGRDWLEGVADSPERHADNQRDLAEAEDMGQEVLQALQQREMQSLAPEEQQPQAPGHAGWKAAL